MSDDTFQGTKHAGRRFSEVYGGEKGYVGWARRGPRNGELARFVAYCDARDGAETHGTAEPLGPGRKRPASFGEASGGDTPPPAKGPRVSTGSAASPGSVPSNGSPEAASGGVFGNPTGVCELCESANLPWPTAFRCGACWRQHRRLFEEDFFLRVPFAENKEARRRGARWSGKERKWFVPAKKDVALCDKWVITCCKCGEYLNNINLGSGGKGGCRGASEGGMACKPECQRDAEARRQAQQLEEERIVLRELEKESKAEQERKLKEMRERIKREFAVFLLAEAAKLDGLAAERNSEEKAAGNGEQSKSKRVQSVPVEIPAGGLVQHVKWQLEELSNGSEEAQYNPFADGESEGEGGPSKIPPAVTGWLRSFGAERFKENPYHDDFYSRIEFRPARILDWGTTFHHVFLDEWTLVGHREKSLRTHVNTMRGLVSEMLLQCLDAVTPDLAILIRNRLLTDYGTTCPDVVGIFGSRILPRIRATVGREEFGKMSQVSRAKWCVLEYMQHRKGYDEATGETEQTTLMRDTLNMMIRGMLGEDVEGGAANSSGHGTSPVLLSKQANSGKTDAVYFATADGVQSRNRASVGSRYFMLRTPNTAAADLFDMAISEEGKPSGFPTGGALSPAKEHRWRALRLFRQMHARVTRKVGADYAKYGVDEGLRESDKMFQTVQRELPEVHRELLGVPVESSTSKASSKGSDKPPVDPSKCWTLRDYLGWTGKRLHSNTRLPELLFIEHLGMKKAAVGKFHKHAENNLARLREEAEKKREALKKELTKEKIEVKELVEVP